MSDTEEAQVQQTSNVLPQDVLENAGTIKLFNKWDYSG
jgi:hypothetical protein